LRVDSKQLERVPQPRWTHAARGQQLRARKHFGRWTLGGDFALAQNDYAIGGAQLLGFVLDHDQAQALRAQLFDQLENFRSALWIEIGSRLVEHDHRRPQRQHRRDREPLLFAARQRHRIAMLEAAQPDRLERGHDSPIHLGAFHADLFHRERDFVRDIGREQLRLEILEDHADLRRDLADPQLLERFARDANRAMEIAILELGDDAVDAFRQRRFTRARRAHHANHFARVLREAHRSQRRAILAVVRERDTFDPHCVLAGSSGKILRVGFHIMNRPANANSRNGPTIISTGLS
jgi:hypothetical protein